MIASSRIFLRLDEDIIATLQTTCSGIDQKLAADTGPRGGSQPGGVHKYKESLETASRILHKILGYPEGGRKWSRPTGFRDEHEMLEDLKCLLTKSGSSKRSVLIDESDYCEPYDVIRNTGAEMESTSLDRALYALKECKKVLNGRRRQPPGLGFA